MTNKQLISYLHSDLFIPDLKAGSKLEAISEMVSHLVEKGRLKDRRIVLEALKTREKLGSTGIGKGVALPHSRSTVTDSLTLLMARSMAGVDFDALDEKPVHLFFMILAPHQEKSSEYLPLLGKLVEVTKDANLRKKLLKVPDMAGVVEALEKAKAK
jgi:PTS system nitrogen regulatory IIA component